MTEEKFNRLATEARERHKYDPAWNPEATESDKFWHDWSGWMRKKATMGVRQGLSYMGHNDPTASTAVGLVMHETKVARKNASAASIGHKIGGRRK